MAVFSLNGLIYSLYTNLELNKIGVEFGFLMKMKIVTTLFQINEKLGSRLAGSYLISGTQVITLH